MAAVALNILGVWQWLFLVLLISETSSVNGTLVFQNTQSTVFKLHKATNELPIQGYDASLSNPTIYSANNEDIQVSQTRISMHICICF